MMSDPLFSQLLLVGLVWLCLMLHGVWPYDRATSGPTPPRPAKAPPRRSSGLKPFPGLTRTPPCAACEQAHEPVPQPPGGPPPRLMPTRGRPRQVDTSWHFCPHPHCAYRNWVGLGHIRANGHPTGGPWRQLHCPSCGGDFQETQGTPLHGKRVAPEKLVWAVGALAEGWGIRAVARGFEVDPNTVLAWRVEAAAHLQAFSQYCLHDVHVTQGQRDALFALLSAVKAGELHAHEALHRWSRAPHWVGVAMDPVTKVRLAIDVGTRTLAMAQGVLQQVVQLLAPHGLPLFRTDGSKEDATALLTHCGQWVQPLRRQDQGPHPKPRWMPLPQLLSAPVVQTVRRRRLVRVRHRGVFGTLEAVQQVLAAGGWQINTAFVERVHLTLRQHVAAVGRRVATLCKGEDGWRQPRVLYQVY